MKKLTTAEEQVMQILWKIRKGFVKDIIAEMPEPKPAYNTVSTILRILEDPEKRGFVSHETFGKSHRYYPLIDKETYSNQYLKNFISDYFNGSFKNMVSFFAKKNDVDIKEFEEMMNKLNDSDEKK